MKPKTKELDIDIPQNPFDEVDDYDDDLYEDDLIDDLDVIIPPKVYLTSIIPNLNHSYERLGNQILDDMNGWYDDMKFRMKGKKSEK